MDRWQELSASLEAISHYPDDWDGYGSPAITADTMKAARAFLASARERDSADPPFRIVPSSGGEISFEWQGAGRFAQADVSAVGVEWFIPVNSE